MVDYTTRVIISLKDIEQSKKMIIGNSPTSEDVRNYGKTISLVTERLAGMMEILASHGFQITAKKDYIYADSDTVEAVATRRILAEHGFADREYQIYLEYRRQWGVM